MNKVVDNLLYGYSSWKHMLMSTSPKTRQPYQGFNLTELLVCLVILAEIATFTIPKILVSQQHQQYNAGSKDIASMISGAYQQLQYSAGVSSATKPPDLTPYMNYLSIDTSSTIDNMNGGTTSSCSSNDPCLNLHNGGKLMLWRNSFGGTATTNVIMIQFDPDGRATDGTTNGPGKSVKFLLYYNGMLTTRANTLPGTTDNSATYTANATADPSWFSW